MSPADVQTLARGNNAFALDLYRQLRKADGNLFFAPFSISTALAMTYAGARGGTESQMTRVLHFEQTDESLHAAFANLQAKLTEAEAQGGIKLKVANSLWPQIGYPFLAAFLDLTLKYYGVRITPVDYAGDTEGTRQIINAWVEEKTEKKIIELIPSGMLDALTRLALVNAIYFKGNWARKFDPKWTRRGDFWSPQGKVYASMMIRTDEYPYAETESLQILELPYAGEALSMVILLPKEKDGLVALEDQLTPAYLDQATAELRRQQVFVNAPRFKTEAAFKLNEMLIELGMSDAFNFKRANFTGMDGSEKGFFISAALHKAFIEVNEEGSEAAAATAVVFRSKGLSESIEFRADHPFLFIIRENQTGSILFMGRLMKP
ncbi:MAG: serpin family protein [Chloroflexota bacterium]